VTEVLSPLIARLKRSEGWSDSVYLDTRGFLTIGYGHNLAKVQLPAGVPLTALRLIPVNGISESIGEMLLLSDVAAVMHAFATKLPWFDAMDAVRREVLVELGYNLGVGKVLSFPVFMDQLQRGEYAAAAANMRGWAWVQQVHEARAFPLIRMMETGARE